MPRSTAQPSFASVVVKWSVAIAFCVIPATQAFGHAYVKYVSTPITPPLDFRWWWPFAAIILLVSTVVSFRVVLGHSLKAAVPRALFGLAVPVVCFYLLGTCSAGRSTTEPPTLGVSYRAFRGLGWSEGGADFLIWNLFGVACLLIGIALLAGRKHSRTKWLTLMIIEAVAYTVTLTPYLVSGAYLHGWAGGYVHMACMDRLDQLTDAVCDYADAHGGILPTASTIDDLIRIVQPNIKEEFATFRSFPMTVCPLGGAYERTPRKYQWDESLSGQQLTTLDKDRMMSRGLIACPYHKRIGTKSILRIMDSLKHQASRPATANDKAASAASP